MSNCLDYIEKGKSLYASKEYVRATEYFQAAIADNPKVEEPYLLLADTFLMLKKEQQAFSVIYSLLSVDPDNSKAKDFLAKNKKDGGANQAKTNSASHSQSSPKFNLADLGLKFVFVEGGGKMLGSTDTVNNPLHMEYITPFYISRHPVTEKQWRMVMGKAPSKCNGDDYPVCLESWYDCKSFVDRLSSLSGIQFRLPTEDEWEYAARGGVNSQKYIYSGGNNIDEVANYRSSVSLFRVGTLKPNELGLYDMSGLVWEWCMPDGSGDKAPIRGGSWTSTADYCKIPFGLCVNKNNPVGGVRLIVSQMSDSLKAISTIYIPRSRYSYNTSSFQSGNVSSVQSSTTYTFSSVSSTTSNGNSNRQDDDMPIVNIGCQNVGQQTSSDGRPVINIGCQNIGQQTGGAGQRVVNIGCQNVGQQTGGTGQRVVNVGCQNVGQQTGGTGQSVGNNGQHAGNAGGQNNGWYSINSSNHTGNANRNNGGRQSKSTQQTRQRMGEGQQYTNDSQHTNSQRRQTESQGHVVKSQVTVKSVLWALCGIGMYILGIALVVVGIFLLAASFVWGMVSILSGVLWLRYLRKIRKKLCKELS